MNAIKHLGGTFDFDVKKSRLDQISKELEDPSIWNDQAKSQTLGKEKRELDFIVNGLETLAINLKDQCELFELARIENDDETLKVVLEESDTLEKSVEAMEFRRMFSHPMDATIVSLTSNQEVAALKRKTGQICFSACI